MNCSCGKPSETAFKHLGPLCKECFIAVLQRRGRKALKDSGWLQAGQKVHLVDETTAQGKAASRLFKDVIKGLPIHYVPAEQAAVLLVGKTADDEAEDFLHKLFEGKLVEKPSAVNILANITTEEIEQYCAFEGITGKFVEKSVLRAKLDELEKRYSGTFFALQKSQDSFRKE